jgi:hypothetical protein
LSFFCIELEAPAPDGFFPWPRLVSAAGNVLYVGGPAAPILRLQLPERDDKVLTEL